MLSELRRSPSSYSWVDLLGWERLLNALRFHIVDGTNHAFVNKSIPLFFSFFLGGGAAFLASTVWSQIKKGVGRLVPFWNGIFL